MKNRFFRYSGSKFNYTELVNPLINKSNKTVYVEPFIGSGAILFNLEKEFDKYIINDLDRNIVNIYKTFQQIDYNYYKEKIEFIKNKFGRDSIHFQVPNKDRKSEKGIIAKQNYYNFRNWFNENYWNTNTIEEGIYCFFLANMVINSFLRFGPNGMNQSWGNRFYSIDEKTFNNIHKRLQKTEIFNEDYKIVLKIVLEKYPDAIYYLDPPYFSQGSSYEDFNEKQIKEFLELIKDKEYIYTDILNEHNKHIENKILIRNMRNTGPTNEKKLTGNMEYLFTNLPIDKSNNELDEKEW